MKNNIEKNTIFMIVLAYLNLLFAIYINFKNGNFVIFCSLLFIINIYSLINIYFYFIICKSNKELREIESKIEKIERCKQRLSEHSCCLNCKECEFHVE